ncbi:hypothetical protein EI94DRAFT_441388 [Lactarius quietus]|nr:hypothetical protein EI94DRAFT_441388 [Lactarius quietus]
MGAIQTSLAVLQAGSALASKLPFIAPIAGLLLQALTMRDEMKQYKEECEIEMHKLARIAKIIVNLCEKYDLCEEDLPANLRNILDSLQRELDGVEQVLRKCSKRKGIKRFLLRKDLLTRIKQCDVELSNVLQAFQADLLLDVRVALIVRPEAVSDSRPIEAIPLTPQNSNVTQTVWSIKGALDALRATLGSKELNQPIGRCPRDSGTSLDSLTLKAVLYYSFFLNPLIPD